MAQSGFMVTRRRLPCVTPSPSAEWSRSVAPMCESSVSACVMTMLSAGSRASGVGMARVVMGYGAPAPSVISTLM